MERKVHHCVHRYAQSNPSWICGCSPHDAVYFRSPPTPTQWQNATVSTQNKPQAGIWIAREESACSHVIFTPVRGNAPRKNVPFMHTFLGWAASTVLRDFGCHDDCTSSEGKVEFREHMSINYCWSSRRICNPITLWTRKVRDIIYRARVCVCASARVRACQTK